MHEGPYLSIVIPAYNEETRIGHSLKKILFYLERKGYSYELIVVDDGSKDETLKVISRIAERDGDIRVLRNKNNCGKGYAVKKGMLNAKGSYILFTDADLSTPISELDKFLQVVKNGYDIIIGSRKVSGAQIEVHQSWLREFIGKGFTWLTNIVVTKDISDVTCGFKCFKKAAARAVFSKQKLYDWSFDAEILFLAQKYGYQVKQMPVRWRNDSRTKFSVLRDILPSLLGLAKIRVAEWRGKYENHLDHEKTGGPLE